MVPVNKRLISLTQTDASTEFSPFGDETGDKEVPMLRVDSKLYRLHPFFLPLRPWSVPLSFLQGPVLLYLSHLTRGRGRWVGGHFEENHFFVLTEGDCVSHTILRIWRR